MRSGGRVALSLLSPFGVLRTRQQINISRRSSKDQSDYHRAPSRVQADTVGPALQRSSSAKGKTSPMRIRVVSSNLMALPVGERAHAMGRLLADLAPDLVGTQEAAPVRNSTSSAAADGPTARASSVRCGFDAISASVPDLASVNQTRTEAIPLRLPRRYLQGPWRLGLPAFCQLAD